MERQGILLPASNDPELIMIQFPVNVTAWPASGLRRASVNSFGYGGANAHVVLDDAFYYMRHHGISGSTRR